jgi:soluble lytic murein transglycosylase-like protein
MTSLRPVAAFLFSLTLGTGVAGAASATTPPVLTAQDVVAYRAAFNAEERGDLSAADLVEQGIRDPVLLGELRMMRLMHPTAYNANYTELSSWLRQYSDLPFAERVYNLALRRRGSADLPQRPMLMVDDSGSVDVAARPTRSAGFRAAREAYYNGDVTRALSLAESAGEHWIGGLASYRLGNYAGAVSHFAAVARNPAEDPWLRAAAGFWAARAADAAGLADQSSDYLQIAANFPTTFYGLLAARRLELNDDPLGHVVQASLTVAESDSRVDLVAMIRSDPRARRAVALTQLGRTGDAALELRAGLALAQDDAARARWSALALALNPVAMGNARTADINYGEYPNPDLAPRGGFVLDRALVLALVRQESRFDPEAQSPAGAVGLMQLMPTTAALAARLIGAEYVPHDRRAMRTPANNLQIGQAYLAEVLEREVNFDILQALAAYNGGPMNVTRTLQRLPGVSDPLMIMESLPYQETRNYVERVMANYWIYRRQFRQPTATLDAVVAGARSIDIRLDRLPGQPMQPFQASVAAASRAYYDEMAARLAAAEAARQAAASAEAARAAGLQVASAQQPSQTAMDPTAAAVLVSMRETLSAQDGQPAPHAAPAPAPAAQGQQQSLFSRPVDPAAGSGVQRPVYEQSLSAASPTHNPLQPAFNGN